MTTNDLEPQLQAGAAALILKNPTLTTEAATEMARAVLAVKLEPKPSTIPVQTSYELPVDDKRAKAIARLKEMRDAPPPPAFEPDSAKLARARERETLMIAAYGGDQ
jgi:hypothetical protein